MFFKKKAPVKTTFLGTVSMKKSIALFFGPLVLLAMFKIIFMTGKLLGRLMFRRKVKPVESAATASDIEKDTPPASAANDADIHVSFDD